MKEPEAEEQRPDGRTPDEKTPDLVLETELDAPPEKVWRAISLPAFREAWLPKEDLADAEPVSSEPGAEVSYRMKDRAPPFLESLVTFQIRPGAGGGTHLRIVHVLADERLTRRQYQQQPRAANSNRPLMMQAMMRAA